MKKYKILSVIIVFVYFIQSFLIAAGGVGADSLSYFGIASDLPALKTNLFPLGYPFVIKLFQLVVKDYYWSAKILNVVLMSFILLFSHVKKFYFRETVLLFTGKTLFFVFCGILSESLFIFLMYFFFYFLHKVVVENVKSISNYISISLILVCLVITRYSGIYVYLSIFLFLIYLLIIKKEKVFTKSLLVSVIFSGIGILGYLLFNYFYFGSFTAEGLRGEPSDKSSMNILRNVLGFFNVLNPYIGIKPASLSLLSTIVQLCVFVIDVWVFRLMYVYFKNSKKSPQYYFHLCCWFIVVVYSCCVLASGWFQQIEEMNVRMMAIGNFILFFSFLICYFEKQKNDFWIFRIGCFFLIFLFVYSVKIPSNFYSNRKQIEEQMGKFKNKKYLFNNEKEIQTSSEYTLPLINKTFRYTHTNIQNGELKQNLAGSINPQIKWIRLDSMRNKKEVLYTSELILK